MTFTTVQSMLAVHLNMRPASIKPTSLLIEDLGLDSLDLVELSMALEEEFHISLLDAYTKAPTTIRTVIDLVTYINTTTAANKR